MALFDTKHQRAAWLVTMVLYAAVGGLHRRLVRRIRIRSLSSIIIALVLVGLVQGILMYLAFQVFGLPNALFWGAAVMMFSLLPIVGSALVWVPAALVLFFDGRTGSAVGMVIWGLTMGTLVDYLIRPYVSNRFAQIHPLITLTGAIGGVSYLGILGLLIGPLALSYFFELLTMYQKEYLARSA